MFAVCNILVITLGMAAALPPGLLPGVPPVINLQEYCNFLKIGKAVKCTAEGLTDFAGRVVDDFHQSLLRQHGNSVCTRVGILKRIAYDRNSNRWRVDCPCAVCEPWMRCIANELATPDICWENARVDDWPVDAWQLAKPFMGAGKAATCNTPHTTDPGGVLDVMINCKIFHHLLDIHKVEAVSYHLNTLLAMCR